MNQNTLLKEIGLSEKEAKIYQILLKIGVSPANKLILEAEMPRGTVYEILNELTNKGLVEQFEDKKKTHFRVKHPFALKSYLADEIGKIKQAETKLESVLPDFLSIYNLTQNRPGVEFYEGLIGVKKVAMDSLTSQTEIYSYIDNEAVNKFINDINNEYIKKRKKLGIKKKMLTLNNAYIREHAKSFDKDITEIRIINAKYPFATVMQIYDNKISYMTLTDEKMIGVIISDPSIYQMHKSLFEFAWDMAKPLTSQ